VCTRCDVYQPGHNQLVVLSLLMDMFCFSQAEIPWGSYQGSCVGMPSSSAPWHTTQGDTVSRPSVCSSSLPCRSVPLQWYDANVSLPGCDKNMPGSVIAMARLNRPSIMVYGGTIKPGHSVMDGSVLDIVSAFQSYGETGS